MSVRYLSCSVYVGGVKGGGNDGSYEVQTDFFSHFFVNNSSSLKKRRKNTQQLVIQLFSDFT